MENPYLEYAKKKCEISLSELIVLTKYIKFYFRTGFWKLVEMGFGMISTVDKFIAKWNEITFVIEKMMKEP